MGFTWNSIKQVSLLLEPAERQAVLGDLAELGITLRGLLDVTGLALLRHLQSWTSWRPWAMTAALYIPLSFAAKTASHLGLVIYSGHLHSFELDNLPVLIRPSVVLGAPFVAWLAGYALGAIGNLRAASVLLPLGVITVWWANTLSRSMSQFVRPPLWPARDDGWHGSGSHEVVVLGILAVVLIPCIRGFARGLDPRPLSIVTAILFTLLSVPATGDFFLLGLSYLSLPPYQRLTSIVVFWPMAYALTSAMRNMRRQIA